MNEIFLGLDLSTQSLTGVIINYTKKEITFKYSIIFDNELPYYRTNNGVVILENEKVVHSYPLMWLEALELLFNKFLENNVSINDVLAISGSAQQHGTVYLNEKFESTLSNLNINKPLIHQLKGTFSRETSPIWMDSSTTKQCEEIRNKLGGLEKTVKITGSNTFERFSGPQIRKFYQESKEQYDNTKIIHLVSSFIASILLGKSSPIDHGDGAGMNLMNIRTKEWDERALNATAPGLREKLPSLTSSYEIIGKISSYFVNKYRFNPNTLLVAWSGDNPNSLIGVGLIKKGKVAISLGTSDTYFGYLKNLYLDSKGEGHVFGAPTGDYMSLICFKNGSLTRQILTERYNLNWKEFSEILKKTPPGNFGKIMLPYLFPEIVPLVLNPRIYRFGFDENDVEGNIRALIESQFLSMRLHSSWIGEKPKEIYATGGASANKEILQVAANIFNIPIIKFDVSDSAAVGAALRSVKSYYDRIEKQVSWDKLVNNFLNVQHSEIIKPEKSTKKLYDEMVKLYRKYEEYVLNNGKNPEHYRMKFIKQYFKSS